MSSFKDYHLKRELLEGIKAIGFNEPTRVQKEVIPKALKKESLLVQSATGSGKTHAFLIPILQNITESKETQAVIIAPTRELAMQLYDCCVELVKQSNLDITVMKVIGGSNREQEIRKFTKEQSQIIIGTLGKLNDLVVETNVLKIHNAKTIVIDEADMIFDQKELMEVDKIVGKVQGTPQFLVFSATLPKGLRVFLHKYLDGAKQIIIEEENLTSKNIEHIMVQCKAKEKFTILEALIKIINPYLALIFANTKETVDELALKLAQKNFKVGKLHGDLDDRERKQIIKRIHNLEFQYVVVSDIASRGIDIEGVSHVINYDLPKDIEFFIHRTGRTARFDQTGVSFSLYAYDDDDYIKLLSEKGLKAKFYQIKNETLTEAKFEKKQQPKSQKMTIEEAVHKKTPLPKKVKPGYKKKRNEQIKKEIKKLKRERISEIYRKRAKDLKNNS